MAYSTGQSTAPSADKKFLDLVISDLISLSYECKRKYPPVKEVQYITLFDKVLVLVNKCRFVPVCELQASHSFIIISHSTLMLQGCLFYLKNCPKLIF